MAKTSRIPKKERKLKRPQKRPPASERPAHRPVNKDLLMGYKQHNLRDPQRIEQVGELHVLQAKVDLGTATEGECLACIIQDYELKFLEHGDLSQKENTSHVEREDLVWLNDWLSKHLEEYRDALSKLKVLEE